MKLRIQYSKTNGKYKIQRNALFLFWVCVGPWHDTYGIEDDFCKHYESEEDAKAVIIKILLYNLKNEEIRKQRTHYGAGYQPITISDSDVRKKFPEYFL